MTRFAGHDDEVKTLAGSSISSNPFEGNATPATEENESAPLIEKDPNDSEWVMVDHPTLDEIDSVPAPTEENTSQKIPPLVTDEPEKPRKEPDTRYLDYLFEDGSPPEDEPDTSYLDHHFNDTAAEPTS